MDCFHNKLYSIPSWTVTRIRKISLLFVSQSECDSYRIILVRGCKKREDQSVKAAQPCAQLAGLQLQKPSCSIPTYTTPDQKFSHPVVDLCIKENVIQ